MREIPVAPSALFVTATTTLEDLGFSSERIVERAGLPQYQYLRPDAKIPGTHVYRIFERAAGVAGTEFFGLLPPSHLPITAIPGFSKMVSGSPTVSAAINDVNRLYNSASNTARFWKVERDNEIWWLRTSFLPLSVGSRQMELLSLSYMLQTIRLGAGSDWRPTRICLEGDAMPAMDRVDLFADAEILYNRGVSGFRIPRSVLSRPMPFTESAVAPENDRFYGQAPSEEFIASLRQTLRSFCRLGHPRIATIAEIAGMEVRTLQRRLKAERLTFKALVDQARFMEATDLMAETDGDMALAEIAHELGYSDAAHFTRAFRRWAGVSPSEYRSQQRRT